MQEESYTCNKKKLEKWRDYKHTTEEYLLLNIPKIGRDYSECCRNEPLKEYQFKNKEPESKKGDENLTMVCVAGISRIIVP